MPYAELMTGVSFRLLTPEMKEAAIQIKANEYSQTREKLGAREDWRQAYREVARSKDKPTDDEVKPIAHAIYLKRTAGETDETRESTRLHDRLSAAKFLRTEYRDTGSYFKVPGALWGTYDFKYLNPAQQHAAIKNDADWHHRWRVLRAEDADWFQATKNIQTNKRLVTSPNTSPDIGAEAETVYRNRMAQQTDEQRAGIATTEWLEAEAGLKSGKQKAHLPVDAVPGVKPTYPGYWPG